MRYLIGLAGSSSRSSSRSFRDRLKPGSLPLTLGTASGSSRPGSVVLSAPSRRPPSPRRLRTHSTRMSPVALFASTWLLFSRCAGSTAVSGSPRSRALLQLVLRSRSTAFFGSSSSLRSEASQPSCASPWSACRVRIAVLLSLGAFGAIAAVVVRLCPRLRVFDAGLTSRPMLFRVPGRRFLPSKSAFVVSISGVVGSLRSASLRFLLLRVFVLPALSTFRVRGVPSTASSASLPVRARSTVASLRDSLLHSLDLELMLLPRWWSSSAGVARDPPRGLRLRLSLGRLPLDCIAVRRSLVFVCRSSSLTRFSSPDTASTLVLSRRSCCLVLQTHRRRDGGPDSRVRDRRRVASPWPCGSLRSCLVVRVPVGVNFEG